MIDLNSSRKSAARTRAGNLLALLLPAVLISALLMLALAAGATASAQVVTNTADSGPGTLRSAITNAASGAVITFDPSLSGATITLSNTLTINTNLTIDASALPGGLQINEDDSDFFQIFNVASNTFVFLNSLTITNGYSTNYGGGIYNGGTLTLSNCTLSGNSCLLGGGIYNNYGGTATLNQCTLSGNSANNGYGGIGGGIYNLGTTTLNQCTLSGNSAIGFYDDGGGGIYNEGTVTLNQCTLSGNSAELDGSGGGGIWNSFGTMTLNQCTLSGNSASYYGGGGIENDATMTLNQCTLAGNSATEFGGGIANQYLLTLNQCTLAGNSATNGGGGIYNDGTLALNQCTLSGNNAGDGGGIDNDGTLTMTNTIVGGNSGSLGADIYNYYAVLTYGGSNLVQSVDNSGGTITGPAPLTSAPDLAPLGNYGGPTQTMPPLPGSPAIGAGSVAANTFSTDQRGYPRTQNGLIDLGAVELPTVQPFSASPASGTAPLSVQFNSTNFDSDGSAITGWNWSFGDGTTGTGQNPSHVYSTTGIFSPSLIVTNSLGLTLAVSGPSITALPLLVTNTADSGPGTLRSAITTAASGITFAPSLSGATITLSNTLTINRNLTIDASALPGGLQINGNHAVQIFNVASNITVFLNSLTITGGYSTNSDITNSGGGIYNGGTLTLNNCILSGNRAPDGDGGGIDNYGGTLALTNCTLSGNSAFSGGGGIFNYGGAVTLNLCTLSGNGVTGSGGGIFSFHGPLTLNQCTLSGNGASLYGGGIDTGFGTVTLNQCTLSGNIADDGGGIYSIGTLMVTNIIVAENGAYDHGGDIYIGSGSLTYGGSNIVQSVFNSGGTITGPAPITSAPDLAPLGNYGGPTQTMPPLPGSPAIDAGSNAATNNFATDQRGLPRLVGPQVDIGAAEFQASPVGTNADSGPGSLRYAIMYVTNNATIMFDPSLSGATITLSNTLTVNTNLTIDASALPGGLQINGNGSVQIVNVASNVTVFLNSLTITNGYSTNNGDGGIYNDGTLTMNQCILSGNNATNGSGGIFNHYYATLTLNQCTLSGNYGLGGGIYNDEGTLTLNQCTLSKNISYGFGGGICNFLGTATLNQCTLSGNSGVFGGGIYNDYGTLTLNQCTLSGNSALGGGGGIFNLNHALTLTNTIVGGNSGSPGADIYNNSGTLTYGGSITGPAPDLASLGNYGGPTQTMPPLPGSPAIGAGSVAANTFATDQRGYARTQNGLIDIGAVELQSPAANPPVLGNITVPAGGGNGLQFTFTNASAADFTVLTATNVSLALTNWTVLGEVQQVAPGQYQFTDPQAATNPAQFYRVRSP